LLWRVLMQWPTGKLEVSAKTANVGWLYLIENN